MREESGTGEARHRSCGPAPVALLELDDHPILGAVAGSAGKHRVEPFARVAELVLADDAVILELRLVDEERQRLEGVLPAVELCAARLVPHLGDVLSAQLFG